MGIRLSLDDLPPTPAGHFKLCFFAAVLHIIHQVSQSYETWEAMFDEYPFLAGYNNELVARGLKGHAPAAATDLWRTALLEWESEIAAHLPLRAIREAAGLDYWGLSLLLCAGLLEEDVRFGALFEAMQGIPGQHRPTLGLLYGWWKASTGSDTRAYLQRLQLAGLVQIANPDVPRIEWAVQLPPPLWDIVRGDLPDSLPAGITYRDPYHLTPFEALILPDSLRRQLELAPTLLECGDIQTLIIRGPNHNGRRTVLGSVARMMGRGLLEVTDADGADEEHWSLIGALATALNAMPAILLDLAPGETVDLPDLKSYHGPVGVILSKMGSVNGPGADRSLTLKIDLPSADARYLHWEGTLDTASQADLQTISTRLRLTSGNIRRAAQLARSYAALAGHSTVRLIDVRDASRTLNQQALEVLAVHEAVSGDWTHLAAGAETLRELASLESRCRHRESLYQAVGAALGNTLNSGVRALFSGPSGTGKTLAARLLASVLGMDLYRVDLASVINKYIGETEKSLNRLFTTAEELNVILLIDEGDALLTRRTDVHNSNDRYANLETNFLLQRLESYDGIVIVTTNAGDRIDSAFHRRMDAVVEFRLPDAPERWTIWQLHLPPEHHVDEQTLRDIVGRCAMTGGQIRNAVLHASLMALDDGRVITSAHVIASVQREYRKAGEINPLRGSAGVPAGRR